jgi:hypothetical protein
MDSDSVKDEGLRKPCCSIAKLIIRNTRSRETLIPNCSENYPAIRWPLNHWLILEGAEKIRIVDCYFNKVLNLIN